MEYGLHVLIESAVIDEYIGASIDERLQLRRHPLHVSAEAVLVEDAALNIVRLHVGQRSRGIDLVYLAPGAWPAMGRNKSTLQHASQDHGIEPRLLYLRIVGREKLQGRSQNEAR